MLSHNFWKRLYDTKSCTDLGTLYQLRNLINRHNVVTKPEKDVNACDDFFTLVVTAHFLTACMIKLGMKSLDDVPTTGDIDGITWMLPDGDQKGPLYSFCRQEVIDEHVNFSFCSKVNCSTYGILNYANEVMSLGIST